MTQQQTADQDARLSRCRECGQWTWDGRCTLHPEADHDDY